MPSSNTIDARQDEISVKDLLQSVWRSRWLILSVTGISMIVAGIAATLSPKKYEAAIVIAPVTDSSGAQLGALGSLASQLGGIASLAGVSVAGDSKKSESIAVLQSAALAEAYIKENELIPLLFPDRWDSEHKRWKDEDPRKVPSVWAAGQFFRGKVRRVTTDAKTGMITLTIIWTDPVLAAKWANELVTKVNSYLRDKAIAESERNIAYLNSESEKTVMVGAKQAIYSLLQSEINKAMLARGSQEYAFTIIDPASAPESPASPVLLLWLIGGGLVGLSLSAFVLFFRSVLK